MVVRLLQLKEPIITVLSHNKDCALNLSNDQWDLAEDLVSVLRDLELVATRLSGDLYPTLSLLLPLISGLQKTLKLKESDKPIITKVKQVLRKESKRRFSLNCLNLERKAVLAAALDPRFRGLTFLSDGERKKVEECLGRITGAEVQQPNKKQVKQLESDRLYHLLGFVEDDGDEDSVAAQEV